MVNKLLFEKCISDLRVNTTLFDKDTLQANISWKLNGFLGKFFLGITNKRNIINLHMYMYFPERKIDVRLNPRPNEHCSNKPCVVYGLPSVSGLKFIEMKGKFQ